MARPPSRLVALRVALLLSAAAELLADRSEQRLWADGSQGRSQSGFSGSAHATQYLEVLGAEPVVQRLGVAERGAGADGMVSLHLLHSGALHAQTPTDRHLAKHWFASHKPDNAEASLNRLSGGVQTLPGRYTTFPSRAEAQTVAQQVKGLLQSPAVAPHMRSERMQRQPEPAQAVPEPQSPLAEMQPLPVPPPGGSLTSPPDSRPPMVAELAQPAVQQPDASSAVNHTAAHQEHSFSGALRALAKAENDPRGFFLDQEPVQGFVRGLQEALELSPNEGYCLEEDSAPRFGGFGCLDGAKTKQLCKCRGLLMLCWAPNKPASIVSSWTSGDKTVALQEAKSYVLGKCYRPVWLPYLVALAAALLLGLAAFIFLRCCSSACGRYQKNGRELRPMS